MPSRSRASRGRTLQRLVLEDDFSEDEAVVVIEDDPEGGDDEPDDDGGSEEQEGEETQGSSDDDEEREREEFVGRDCGPSALVRVSAAADAGANTPTCPVCMEPWTFQGPHRISCIPCGHVYGRSCLERWLTQRGNRSATCPQCGQRFNKKNIINLYAPEVAIPKNELEKEIAYLRERNDSLEKKVLRHDKLFEEMTKREIVMEQRIIDAVSSKETESGRALGCSCTSGAIYLGYRKL